MGYPLSRCIRPGTALGAAALLLGLASAPVQAVELTSAGKRFDVAFDVFWLGLPVFSGTMSGELMRDRYRVRTTTVTEGILDLLFSAEVQSAAAGKVGRASEVQPERYSSRSRWNDNDRTVDLSYQPDGSVVAVSRPEPDEDDWDYDRDPVSEDLRRGTVDPLSAILRAVSRPLDQAPCAGSVPVYDGKRRYNLRFEFVAEETIDVGEATRYRGPAVKCRAHFDRVAGFDTKGRREDPDPDQDKRGPTVLWLAPLAEGGLWLPLKAELDTRWGAVEAIMAEHKVTNGDGQAPTGATPAAGGEGED